MSDFRDERPTTGTDPALDDPILEDTMPDYIAQPAVSGANDGVTAKVNRSLDAAERVAQKALGADRAARLREKADVAVSKTEEAVYSARDRLDRQIALSPYTSLAVAAGVGFAIGFLLRGRDHTIIYRSIHD